MKINFEVNVENAEQVRAIKNLLSTFVGDPETTVVNTTPAVNTPAVEEKQSKKNTKASKKEETPAPVVEEKEAPKVETKEPTKEQYEEVKSRMTALSDSGKTKDVRDIVLSFGVSKMSEIKLEQYPELLAKIEAIEAQVNNAKVDDIL
jgi:hypothetical protein